MYIPLSNLSALYSYIKNTYGYAPIVHCAVIYLLELVSMHKIAMALILAIYSYMPVLFDI
jgi:hypothetical protein